MGAQRYIVVPLSALFVIALLSVALNSPGRAESKEPNGQVLFEKRCSGCHALDRDKEGPRLGGVYGRAAGRIGSFQYSDALKASKITWNSDTLDQWLIDPEKMVPGNDMAFHVDKPEERHSIIEYLKHGLAK